MFVFFFFKQKTAYEMRISDWSSDVCSSDLRKLLDILACPATRQPLEALDKAALEALNRAIEAGGVRRVDEAAQAAPLREALVTRDHKLVYRVDDGKIGRAHV